MDFFRGLEASAAERDSLLCVGLDPRPAHRPGGAGGSAAARGLVDAAKRVIEATRPFAACFKPNIAFYEALGAEGWAALEETLRIIGDDTPVILDAKRGDIGDTAAAYARAAFERLGVGAITVSPYLGREALEPFFEYPGRGLFVLCRTSNPGSDEIQGLSAGETGGPLYVEIARRAAAWSPRVALVAGATDPRALRLVREAAPSSWILCPGVGAQGGSLEQAVQAGLRSDGLGLLVNASRSIGEHADPAARAREIRDAINAVRSRRQAGGAGRGGQDPRKALFEEIVREGCLRFGQFRLKSGEISPVYLDLRRLVSSPGLLSRVASAYAELAARADYRRIAAIPLAALPIGTALSLRLGRPLVYPRLEAKDHGTGSRVEGAFEKGDKVLLVDDVITSAASKLEAVAILREAGLEVTDLAVLVDREAGGRAELEKRGIRVHACATLSEVLALTGQGGEA
jgi:uridine monophosphate synthetase